MYLLLAPDPTFTGVCGGVEFSNGVGMCESAFLAGWLCAKGFTIPPDQTQTDEPEAPPDIPDDLDALSAGELAALARCCRRFASICGRQRRTANATALALRASPTRRCSRCWKSTTVICGRQAMKDCCSKPRTLLSVCRTACSLTTTAIIGCGWQAFTDRLLPATFPERTR